MKKCKCFDFSALAKHRVQIYRRDMVGTEVGDYNNSAGLIADCFAIIDSSRAKELYVGDRVSGRNNIDVTTRYISDDITNQHFASSLQIRFKGRIFFVKGVSSFDSSMSTEGNIYHTFYCVEGLNDKIDTPPALDYNKYGNPEDVML